MITLWMIGLLFTIGFVDWTDLNKGRARSWIDKVFIFLASIVLLIVAWPLILGLEARKALT